MLPEPAIFGDTRRPRTRLGEQHTDRGAGASIRIILGEANGPESARFCKGRHQIRILHQKRPIKQAGEAGGIARDLGLQDQARVCQFEASRRAWRVIALSVQSGESGRRPLLY